MKVVALFLVGLVAGASTYFSVYSLLPSSPTVSSTKSINNWSGAQAEPPALPPASPRPSALPVIHVSFKPNSRVLLLQDEVSDNAVALAQRLIELDDQSSEPIWLLINSPGGSVFQGGTLVGAMQSARSPVYTVCLQMCASMAAIIHQHGTKRYMVDRSILMFHQAAGGLQGEVEKMQSRLTAIQRYVAKFNSEIARRAGLSLQDYTRLQTNELWIDAQDATTNRFSDGIVSVNLTNANFGGSTLKMSLHPSIRTKIDLQDTL